MNEKFKCFFIDFNMVNRLGEYNNETSTNIFIVERDCISNFNF